MTEVFKGLKSIETAAVIVQANTDPDPGLNCRNLADAITGFKASNMKDKIMELAKKAFKFLYISRKGFYCALCNHRNHEFIDIYSSSIVSSNQFCKNTVENTLAFYIFKFKYFISVARAYSVFLVTCNLKGKFDTNKYVTYQTKFFKEPKIIADIDKCEKNLAHPQAHTYCEGYCSHFNPAKYSELFEGDIDKLKGFSEFLKNTMERKQIEYERESAKDVLKMKGRLLEALIGRHLEAEKEKKDNPEEKKDAEGEKKEENADAGKEGGEGAEGGEAPKVEEPGSKPGAVKGPVDEINNRFRFAIIKPVMYNFDSDMSIEHTIHFTKSIFHQGFYKTFRIHKYKSHFDSCGVDWYGEGKAATINLEGVKKVIDMLPPNDLQVREIFFELIKED